MSIRANSKFIFAIAAFVITFAVAFAAIAYVSANKEVEQKEDKRYNADSMTVTADVHDDFTIDIVEKITVNFVEPPREEKLPFGDDFPYYDDDFSYYDEPPYYYDYYENLSHGIVRSLPTNSGERYTNIRVDGDPSSYTTAKGLILIYIGDEDRVYRPGSQAHYEIAYTVTLPQNDKDNIYYNFIGADFDMVLNNVTVTVNFPEKPMKYDVFSGVEGSTSHDDVVYKLDGNTLTITAEKLSPFHAVTVDAFLPAGTLQKTTDVVTIVTIVVAAVALALAVILFITVGRQPEPVARVNFYPPLDEKGKELTPAEVGMLIDNKCSNEDVTGLIFYWASKGYIDIEGEDEDMTLIMNCPIPDDAAPYERRMFNRLFERAKTSGGEQRVKVSSLSERFYDRIAEAKSGVTAKYKNKLYSPRATTLAIAVGIIAALLIAAAVFFAFIRVSWGWRSPVGLAALLPAIAAYAVGSQIQKYWLKLSGGKRALYMLLFALGTAVLAFIMLIMIPSAVLPLAEKLAIGIGGGAIMVIAPFIGRRTKYYDERLCDILGFRDFLRLAEKDRLEALISEDPQYYYRILPYANVLGVSKVWQDKFAALTIEPPCYYRMRRGDVFTIMYFNRMYNTSHMRMHRCMTSRPQPQFSSGSHSGGGHHGGGFGGGHGGGHSGGGFGGGGSRRW